MAEFMKRFEDESGFVKVDVDHTAKAYTELVSSGSAVLLIMEREGKMIGGLGYVVWPDLHDGETVAIETYWLVDKKCRGGGIRLFNEYEKSAKERGCKRISMVHMVDSYPEILSKLYTRKGYALVEKCYTKELL